jgi:hypothetical protein
VLSLIEQRYSTANMALAICEVAPRKGTLQPRTRQLGACPSLNNQSREGPNRRSTCTWVPQDSAKPKIWLLGVDLSRLSGASTKFELRVGWLRDVN